MFETQADFISWLDQLIAHLKSSSSSGAEREGILNLATQWRALFESLPPTQTDIERLIDIIYDKWLDDWMTYGMGSFWYDMIYKFRWWAQEQGGHVPAKFPPFSQAEDDIALCTQLLQTTGKKGQAYFIRGRAYVKIRQYQPAIRDYTQAIALLPEMPMLYAHRGEAYYAAQEYDLALTDADHTITLAPNNANAYTQRGRIYIHLQQHTLAIRDYTMAIDLLPKDAEAYYERGRAYEVVGEELNALEDYHTTIRFARYAIQDHDLAAYERRGAIYRQKQWYDDAIQEYSHILHRLKFKGGMYRNRPDIISRYSILAHYNLGCLYALQQQQQQAIDALNAAITFGFDDIEHLQHDPAWDIMRASDAFQAASQACQANALTKERREKMIQAENLLTR